MQNNKIPENIGRILKKLEKMLSKLQKEASTSSIVKIITIRRFIKVLFAGEEKLLPCKLKVSMLDKVDSLKLNRLGLKESFVVVEVEGGRRVVGSVVWRWRAACPWGGFALGFVVEEGRWGFVAECEGVEDADLAEAWLLPFIDELRRSCETAVELGRGRWERLTGGRWRGGECGCSY